MKKQFLALLTLGTLFFSSCTKDNSDEGGNGRLHVYLTDDPAKYDAVNIDVREVRIKYSDDASDEGWETIPMPNPGIFNLLQFSNGKDTLISTAELPARRIKQIRLVLGSNNTVVVNGTSHTLETPSAQQSGLKVKVDADIKPGVDYRVWLDFDAGKSIVQTGNGKYILKPVVRAYVKAASGAISGTVAPATGASWVYAIQNTDTIATAIPNTTSGTFMLSGLNAGSYSLSFRGANNYKDTTLTGVSVTVGNVTNVGTVQMKQ